LLNCHATAKVNAEVNVAITLDGILIFNERHEKRARRV
jgi:hypothetical protein